MSEPLKNILRFVLLILLQVFVLNNVLVQGLVTPSLYLLFILLFPKTLPKWIVMILGLLLGLSIDIFMNTGGMHAAACVFIAFIRPEVLSLFISEKGMESSLITPSVKVMGWGSFLVYSTILTFIHHVIYYCLQIFSFNDIFYLAIKILSSTVITLLMIIIFELLFAPHREKSPA